MLKPPFKRKSTSVQNPMLKPPFKRKSTSVQNPGVSAAPKLDTIHHGLLAHPEHACKYCIDSDPRDSSYLDRILYFCSPGSSGRGGDLK
eukprot:5750035-Karenia_brevis.AAC.1